MAADSKTAIAHVQLMDGYRFTATFPDVAGAVAITLDEAAPLGTGKGPTPAGLLAAAVGRVSLGKPDALHQQSASRARRGERARHRANGEK